MNSKEFKKLCCQKNGAFYEIEEDLVGWYLFVSFTENPKKPSADFLFDTLEDALSEAQKKFNIPVNQWKEIIN
jgi:hypothetical protein